MAKKINKYSVTYRLIGSTQQIRETHHAYSAAQVADKIERKYDDMVYVGDVVLINKGGEKVENPV
jgi:hypothetical protein